MESGWGGPKSQESRDTIIRRGWRASSRNRALRGCGRKIAVFRPFGELEGPLPLVRRRSPDACAQLAVEEHAGVAKGTQGLNLGRPVAVRTAGGKDVLRVREHNVHLGEDSVPCTAHDMPLADG